MSALQIRLKKGRDGPHSLVCIRADCTMTMQRQRTGFFPLHDLTHYAVESVLEYRRGFWGLVAEGWNLDDFGTPWPRGALPPEPVSAEQLEEIRELAAELHARWLQMQQGETLALSMFVGRTPARAPLLDSDD